MAKTRTYKKYKKGVFCVVYTLNKKKRPSYLILHRIWHWTGWEFTKGRKQSHENYVENARREVREENGLICLKLTKFKTKGKFSYDKKTRQERKAKGFEWRLFACEVKKGRVKFSKIEHDAYKWCTYSKALKYLTRSDQRKCLKIVHNSIT